MKNTLSLSHSAGVGRTGVFITVDKILDDLDKKKKETINIFGFVKDMRTKRMNMVQTSVRVEKDGLRFLKPSFGESLFPKLTV